MNLNSVGFETTNLLQETIPYNKYGFAKLGAETSVSLLKNFCIIRTSFFNPENIRFDTAAEDAYSSKLPIKELAKAIKFMLNSEFIGAINIGSERKSEYERYKEFKPKIKPCKFKDVLKEAGIPLAKDASLDISLWKRIHNKKNNG